MPRVNPEILRWARETAGLDEAAAARRIGLNDARGVVAADRLRIMEVGAAEPSRSLLWRMATAYRRPLLSFYLGAPPRPDKTVEDFRALPDRRPESEPLVEALVRDVRTRQALVQGVLEDEEAPPIRFIGSRHRADNVTAVADAITADLGFQLARFRQAGSVDAAFAYLRERAEAAGVFVLLIGDLGSYHTELDTEAFRGFALADPIAPFVVVNDRDARAAWAFTLLHELAHLWIGVSGVSGARSETDVERFCNEVASLVLLPAAEAAQLVLPAWTTLDDLADAITAVAAPLRLSRTLVAFRLGRAGAFTNARWEELREHFRRDWLLQRERRKAERGPDARGPNPYVVKRHHLGGALLSLVRRAVSEGALTTSKAGAVLGVRARNVDLLLQEHGN